MEITPERLHELFYIENGKLYNKVRRAKRAKVGEEAGSTTAGGYRQVSINGKDYRVHRLMYMMYHNRCLPNNLCIDHIDRDPLNNHEDNLRLVTQQENSFNTNAKGYYWDRRDRKWRAQIKLNREQIHLGSFDTEEEAATAYREAKDKLHVIEEGR